MAEPLVLIRRRLGMTQRQLAERVGITDGAIGQYEAGIRMPKLKTARKIAEVLGVSLDDIEFGPAEAPRSDSSSQRSAMIVAD